MVWGPALGCWPVLAGLDWAWAALARVGSGVSPRPPSRPNPFRHAQAKFPRSLLLQRAVNICECISG